MCRIGGKDCPAAGRPTIEHPHPRYAVYGAPPEGLWPMQLVTQAMYAKVLGQVRKFLEDK